MSATGEASVAAGGEHEAGATLLEMLVVVALLAMISGLMFANFRPALQRMALDAAATELAYTLRQARAAALRTSTPQAVELAEDGSAYVYGGRRVVLPGPTRLEGDHREVLFSADGLSAGAKLELTDAARRRWVEVDAAGAVTMTGPA